MIELTFEETDVLRRLLRALSGVVPEFIIAGGQAARLLRLHPLATRLPNCEPGRVRRESSRRVVAKRLRA